MKPKDNVPQFRTEDMNLMTETPYMSVETAIRLQRNLPGKR